MLDTFSRTFSRENGISATSIRYLKGKRNVIKRQKLSFLGLYVLLPGFWDFKDILNSRQNRSKNKIKNKRRDTSTWKLLAPGYGLLPLTIQRALN